MPFTVLNFNKIPLVTKNGSIEVTQNIFLISTIAMLSLSLIYCLNLRPYSTTEVEDRNFLKGL
jgi:hypothetical protein